jgi:hypothetical protein
MRIHLENLCLRALISEPLNLRVDRSGLRVNLIHSAQNFTTVLLSIRQFVSQKDRNCVVHRGSSLRQTITASAFLMFIVFLLKFARKEVDDLFIGWRHHISA